MHRKTSSDKPNTKTEEFSVISSRKLVCDHIWIHCNLIASLTLAQLVFIFGIKATEYKVKISMKFGKGRKVKKVRVHPL